MPHQYSPQYLACLRAAVACARRVWVLFRVPMGVRRRLRSFSRWLSWGCLVTSCGDTYTGRLPLTAVAVTMWWNVCKWYSRKNTQKIVWYFHVVTWCNLCMWIITKQRNVEENVQEVLINKLAGIPSWHNIPSQQTFESLEKNKGKAVIGVLISKLAHTLLPLAATTYYLIKMRKSNPRRGMLRWKDVLREQR